VGIFIDYHRSSSSTMLCFRDEISFIYKIFLLSYAQITLSNFLLNATWYLLIITSIYLADHISAATMFLIMDSLNNVSLALRFAIARGILESAKLMAVSKRIARFLETKDHEFTEDENEGQLSQEIVLSDLRVYIKDYKILDNLNLNFQKGLTVITGPTASGKTLLLKVLMKEHQFIEGDVTVNGRISYASQEPWLFPSTIKQNILFASSCDRKRYNEVLEVCALVRDFESFDEGDNTMVANRGTNLSRGQQKRINLARAVYRESDFYLLDDCLSSLDVLVENFIFEKCIRHFLKDKVVVMVSQNKKHISKADNVIDLNDGTLSMKQNLSVQEIPTIKNSEMVRNINVEEQGSFINDVDGSETATLMETKIIEKNIYEESKELANVKLETYVKYFKHGGGIIMLSAILISFCAIQFAQSGVHKLQTNW
jgi:ATP-binding cassette subfamily C (CFTR/MRP) protein 4